MTEYCTSRRIGDALVTVGPSWVVTRYDDGTEVHAHPNGRDEDLARAAELGYPGDDEMTRDHDMLHSLIAEARGWPHSRVLWALAHNEPSPDCADDEEALALFVAKFANERVQEALAEAHDALDVIGVKPNRGSLVERIGSLFEQLKQAEAARDGR